MTRTDHGAHRDPDLTMISYYRYRRVTHRSQPHDNQPALVLSCYTQVSIPRWPVNTDLIVPQPLVSIWCSSGHTDTCPDLAIISQHRSNRSTITDFDLTFIRPSRLDRVAKAPILRLPVNTGPIVPQPPVLTSRSPHHLVGSCYYTEISISRSSVHMAHSCHLVEYDRPTFGSISHDHNATLARS